jgi:hypothetical protein
MSAPHDHRTADGAPLRPILMIEGYPTDPPSFFDNRVLRWCADYKVGNRRSYSLHYWPHLPAVADDSASREFRLF